MCLQLGIFVKNSVLRSTLFHYLRLFTLLLSQLRLCLVMLTLSNVSLAKKKKKRKKVPAIQAGFIFVSLSKF